MSSTQDIIKFDIKQEKDVNEIIPKIWLGNYKAAYNKEFLIEKKINYVISIMKNFDESKKIKNIKYINVPIRDIELNNVDMSHFFKFMNIYIYQKYKQKKNILIHCKNGHHRSAAVMASFLIYYLKIDKKLIISYIKKLRPYSFRRKTNITDWIIFN